MRLAHHLIAAFLLALIAGGASAGTVTIAVISDMNGRYGSTRYSPDVSAAIERIIEIEPDVVLSTGDMVAGQRLSPKLTDDELATMWRSFHATVTAPLRAAGLPVAATPGNHDASAYDGFSRERERYRTEWATLSPGLKMVDRGNFPFHFAFSVSDVLFVSLDATVVGALPEAQMNWLEGLLARTEGKYRARIAFSHLPLWPFAIQRETEIIGDPALAELFRRSGVQMHLSGHHHAYYPGASNGMLLIGQACLGGGARRLIGTAEAGPRSFTIIEIGDDGAIDVYALQAPDFTRRIDPTTLPERIVSHAATITRMDLASPSR